MGKANGQGLGRNILAFIGAMVIFGILAALYFTLVGKETEVSRADDAARLAADSGIMELNPENLKMGPVQGPWIALRKKMGSTAWAFLASSEEEKVTAETLKGMKTLILCEGTVGASADYSSLGSTSTQRKKSEKVTITYIDLESGARIGTEDVIEAKELPKSTKNSGNFVYSDPEVKDAVLRRLNAGVCPGMYREDWETDADGAVTAWTTWRAENVTDRNRTPDYRILAVPEGTEKIRSAGPTPEAAQLKPEFSVDEELLHPRALYIPGSVTEIAEGALQDYWFVIVPAGSYAESWARENGVPYSPDGSGTILVPENTEPDRLAFLQNTRYSTNPLASLAGRLKITRMEIPAACDFSESGLPGGCGLLFVVAKDSLAEAGLRESAEYTDRDVPYVWPENDTDESMLSLRPGDTVVLGRYEQDGNEENGKEPIHWTVLNVRGDQALLLSTLVLDMNAWMDDRTGLDYWKNSWMREWLNGEFADAAFTEEEKACLSPSEPGRNYKIFPQEDGSECLFLLTNAEYECYGVSDYTAPTPYAVSRGAKRDEDHEGHCYWLFRNTDNPYALEVNVGGRGNPAAHDKAYGVLPAVWVSMRGGALMAENISGGDSSPVSQKERITAQAKELAPGDTVFFGRYNQEGTAAGQEEIEWNVLEVRDGRALLLSRYVLDLRCQHEYRYAYSNWDESQLRTWLNTTFFNEAFTAEQRAAVCVSTISNKAEEISESARYDRLNTVDRVFLLSWKDVFVRYFPEKADRRAVPVPAVTCRGPKTVDGCCGWWLRSNDSSDTYYAVGESGELQWITAFSKCGVRPAIWLDLSAFAEEPEGEKVKTE